MTMMIMVLQELTSEIELEIIRIHLFKCVHNLNFDHTAILLDPARLEI